MAADAELFKRVMRRWASAVTIVTTKVDDQIHGLTVSGFAGISLDPPRVMVSVGHNQNSHLWLQDGGCYAVNFLHEDQVDVSDRFAGRMADVADRFAGVPYHTRVSGAPILDECLAWFDCKVVAAHVVGDHTIFIGEVLAGEVVSHSEPLLYYDGAYRRLGCA
jgi:flavin reductase (DIM6/NTAB) family NADH-FMN oxidoreductase RutF